MPTPDQRENSPDPSLSYYGLPSTTSYYLFQLAKRDAASYLNFLMAEKLVEPRHYTGKVIDFGCGYGGSSKELAERGASVVAIDVNPFAIKLAQNFCTPYQIEFIARDGIQFILDQPGESIDMITAFMLGPDMQGEFSARFYAAAQHALKEDGRLVCASDYQTMGYLSKVSSVGRGSFIQLEHPGHPLYVGSKAEGTAPPFGETPTPAVDKYLTRAFHYFTEGTLSAE